MTDQDRIRLAEAMGWIRVPHDFGSDSWENSQGFGHANHVGELPNPFTDANDDYAVLGWMRDEFTPDEIELCLDHIGQGHRWAYETGNYAQGCLALLDGKVAGCPHCARAALKVLEGSP